MTRGPTDRAAAAGGARPSAAAPARPDEPPLAVLVDFDGTIVAADVTDLILRRYAGQGLEEEDDLYSRGLAGSRTLSERQVARLPPDRGLLEAVAAATPADPTFATFVREARRQRVAVEIVSDGFGFYIPATLETLGVPDVPLFTAVTSFAPDGVTIRFPNGHPSCFVCGTCKRNRVLAQRALGRVVAFVGDGEGDRYAAAHADLVFARDALVRLCESRGWPYRLWRDFGELADWLAATVEAWRVDPATLRPRPDRGLRCGPEVWGPGRTAPAPGFA